MGIFTKMFMPVGLGGLGVGKNPFSGGGGGDSGGGLNDMLALIDQYSYKPQYTGQTEKQLYDLFGQLTGTSGGGASAIPFDIGMPTTGLYDALTRGIKEEYLGTPGGPEGGRIADIRAYYNNMGIPEAAINQERLANNDLNSLLTDQAARINESQKDRLTQVLGLGSNIGSNLYGQNLQQHRANAGLALNAAGMDAEIQDSIRQANQQSLNDLLGGIGAIAGTMYGGPAGGMVGQQAGSGIGNLFGGNASVSRTGGANYYPGVPSILGAAGSQNSGSVAKLI